MWKHGNELNLGGDEHGEPVRMSADMRSRHCWVAGLTGTGKTSFMEGLIRQDIEHWVRSECGICVIDPDGALYRNLMTWLSDNEIWMARRPIVPIDFTQDEWVIAFDVLRARSMPEATIAQNVTAALAHSMGQGDLSQTPLFARVMESVALALIVAKRPITDAVLVLSNKTVRETVIREVRGKMSDWHFATLIGLADKGKHDETSSTLNRLFRLLRNESIRRMLSISQSTHGHSFDFGRALDAGSIVLINLNPEGGYIQSDDAKVFASLVLSDLWSATLARGARPENKPFYLYIDELAQYASSPVLPEMLQRGRKYGLHLTLGNQYPKQLKQESGNPDAVLDAIKAGCSSQVVFHLRDEVDLQITSGMLFRDQFDIDEQKHVLEATKVLEHREEMRRSTSRGSTSVESSSRGSATSQSSGDSQMDGSNEGLTLSQAAFPTESTGFFFAPPRTRIKHENVGELEDEQFELTAQVNASRGKQAARGRSRAEAKSESEMEGSARGESYSETYTPTLVPVLGKEVSSITFRSLEEQRHRAMAQIQGLKARQALVRLVDTDKPVRMHTTTIKQPAIAEREQDEMVSAFAESALARLPFAIKRSAMALDSEMLFDIAGVDEPESFSVPSASRATVKETHAETHSETKPKARRKSPAAKS